MFQLNRIDDPHLQEISYNCEKLTDSSGIFDEISYHKEEHNEFKGIACDKFPS